MRATNFSDENQQKRILLLFAKFIADNDRYQRIFQNNYRLSAKENI
jgi:hypothetical protein